MSKSQEQPELVLLGGEDPFGADVLETLGRLEWKVIAAVLNGDPKWEVSPVPVVLQVDEVSDMLTETAAVLGPNLPRHRRRVRDYAEQRGFGRFPIVVDPNAVMAQGCRVEEGVYVNAGAVTGGHTVLEAFAVMNRNSSIGHHCVLERYAMLGPGAVAASNCRIGEGGLVGAGAVLRPDIVVGPGSVVGAGAVVVSNVEAGKVVAGNPARVIKDAEPWASDQLQSS